MDIHVRSRRTLAGIGSAVAALLLAPAAGAAPIFQVLPDDATLNARIVDEAFAGEGRIGDLGGAMTFEADVGPSTASPADTAQFAWSNGDTHSFTFSYDDVSDEVRLTINGGAADVAFTTSATSFDTLWIRTRALLSLSSVSLTGQSLDGDAVPNVTASGPNGLSILEIRGADLQDGFSLTGTTSLAWDAGNMPSQSELAFQLKVGTVVPEPTTGLLLAAGLAGLALAGRSRPS